MCNTIIIANAIIHRRNQIVKGPSKKNDGRKTFPFIIGLIGFLSLITFLLFVRRTIIPAAPTVEIPETIISSNTFEMTTIPATPYPSIEPTYTPNPIKTEWLIKYQCKSKTTITSASIELAVSGGIPPYNVVILEVTPKNAIFPNPTNEKPLILQNSTAYFSALAGTNAILLAKSDNVYNDGPFQLVKILIPLIVEDCKDGSPVKPPPIINITAPNITIPPPNTTITTPHSDITITTPPSDITITTPPSDITITTPPPDITITAPPPITNTPGKKECNDGIDNDNDGFIDLADSECKKSSDPKEDR